MSREETKSNLLVAAMIASCAIFLFGLLLGNYLATTRIEKFQETEEFFLVQLIALEFREPLVRDVCGIEWEEIWEFKTSLGRMLTSLEKRLGKDNKKLKTRKEIYELIEIKIFNILERIKEECNEDFDLVLFFYTNKKNDPLGSVAACEDQGLIIDQIVREREKKINVFAFDINSKNVASITLRKKYNITRAPSLVINGKTYGYLTKKEIEKLLDS
ncbi:MAG: hypothetical protein NZ889_02110 [Candidatus Pacearchaeota archaeon]|nr:hypothetical protein [Candidatus Pacearchaeota archaeon]